MTLSPDEVAHVAMLARLGLDDDEKRRIAGELDLILEHISALQRADISNIPETAQVGDLVNVWREDEPEPSLTEAQALANAPDTDGEYFRVGAIQE
ncbi:MAG: Asp-tRNA(Asn)/Glu-tRNA(Gln) amidotransferase subunit GatC [Candidatus Dormibacteraeota bacterium]|uniref:Aspartyl/glutamyl-tRNA(Asn/Gln) amidotransferase subunit C n=1 Tax=Candidatus Aeolococcus gillhamiae TaxID=3127015 RepID=A0A2W5Z314_9BACT|nr:Asp-tRNA(Asn)/Glu-tRNA(Gln) amidotransferase subunit GatC [Candidatus Dormibacteraeota bacterium]PZR78537.1 MAG: Asp-tRNA(Asn)/Glu-tRNA(Gln) amidotransferase GatCAB subunit C [Candidatus Dormibacter sp. RRmetagenome_bin12]